LNRPRLVPRDTAGDGRVPVRLAAELQANGEAAFQIGWVYEEAMLLEAIEAHRHLRGTNRSVGADVNVL